MLRDWWLLPGPGEFVRRAADELREGRNLALCLPRHLPDGLAEAVRAERFPDGEAGAWHTLAAIADGPSPVRQVAERLLPSVPTGPLPASWLAQHEQTDGAIVWVDDLTPQVWPAWRDFLHEYAHACRARPLLERLVLVVPLVGPVASSPPEEDVALAACCWREAVEPLDQLLYVWRLLRFRALPRLQREVVAAVVAGLALWDPWVSHLLIELPVDRLLRPEEALASLNLERRWTTPADSDDVAWQEGMLEHFAGGPQVHSAALLLDRSTRGRAEMDRRVWSAQVGVLLPYVEERRRELLERLDGQLSGPFHFSNGLVIDDPHELEIGQIEYQLARRGRKIPRLLPLLKQVRNRLAHLQVVDSDLLQDGDLTRPL